MSAWPLVKLLNGLVGCVQVQLNGSPITPTAGAGTAADPHVLNIVAAGGGGDVTGPGPTVADTAVALFDGTGGLTLKESPVLHGASGDVTGVRHFTLTGTFSAGEGFVQIADAATYGQLQLFEAAASGTNKFMLSAPTLATDLELFLPASLTGGGVWIVTDGGGGVGSSAVGQVDAGLLDLADDYAWSGAHTFDGDPPLTHGYRAASYTLNNDTATAADNGVLIGHAPAGTNRTQTLPAAATAGAGARIAVIKLDNSLATVGFVATGGDTIHFGLAPTIGTAQGDSATMVSNGVDAWYLVT